MEITKRISTMVKLFGVIIFLMLAIYLSFIFSLLFIILNSKTKIYWLIIFFIFLLIYLALLIFLTVQQYQIWKTHPISRYLLPPHQNIFYFLSYTYHHIYKGFLFRLIAAFLVWLIIIFLNYIFKNSLFYEEESFKIPILTTLMDFPLNLGLLLGGLLLIFLIHLIGIFFKKSLINEKISLKDYWVFICFLFIIINYIEAKYFEIGILEKFRP